MRSPMPANITRPPPTRRRIWPGQGFLSRHYRRHRVRRGSERRFRARPAIPASDLGFTFTAPDGFTLDNTAQAVLGVKRGGGQALRLDVVRVPAEQTLAAYLTSGWIENIDPATVDDVIINGFPGATAAAKGDQWDFRLYAIRFGSDVYRFIFAAKHRTPETDRVFRESVGTFRRMSLAEIEQAKPLHLSSNGGARATPSRSWPAAWR